MTCLVKTPLWSLQCPYYQGLTVRLFSVHRKYGPMARGQWILLSVQWILFLTCPTDKWSILRNSPYRSTVKSILLIQIFWRVVEMTFGLVNARFCKNDFLCTLLLVFTNFLKTICFFFCVWESLFNFIHISSRKQLGSTKHQKDCSNNEYKSGKGI